MYTRAPGCSCSRPRVQLPSDRVSHCCRAPSLAVLLQVHRRVALSSGSLVVVGGNFDWRRMTTVPSSDWSGTASDYQRAWALSAVVKARSLPADDGDVADRVHWVSGHVLWYRMRYDDRHVVVVDASAGKVTLSHDADRWRELVGGAVDEVVVSPPDAVLARAGRRWMRYDVASNRLTSCCSPSRSPTAANAIVSVDGGTDTSITFVNKSGTEVSMCDHPFPFSSLPSRLLTSPLLSSYWVDTRGSSRHYADVAAGADHYQHTYSGHAWRVEEKRARRTIGQCVATVCDSLVEVGDGQLTLTEKKTKRRSVKKLGRAAGGCAIVDATESPDGRFTAAIKETAAKGGRTLQLRESAPGTGFRHPELTKSYEYAKVRVFVLWAATSNSLPVSRATIAAFDTLACYVAVDESPFRLRAACHGSRPGALSSCDGTSRRSTPCSYSTNAAIKCSPCSPSTPLAASGLSSRSVARRSSTIPASRSSTSSPTSCSGRRSATGTTTCICTTLHRVS